jgi:hypothetical protein
MLYLTESEAISFLLSIFPNKKVKRKTSLNKLLARFPLSYVPVDIRFELNQYGTTIESGLESPSYRVCEQVHNDLHYKVTELNREGFKEAGIAEKKLKLFLGQERLAQLVEELKRLNELSVSEISEEEHEMLLVDVDKGPLLVQRVSETYISYLDFMNEIKDKRARTEEELELYSLIELGYLISLFLHTEIFPEESCDYKYGENMYHYYFIYLLYSLIGKIKNALSGGFDPEISLAFKYFDTQTQLIEYKASLYNKECLEILENASI